MDFVKKNSLSGIVGQLLISRRFAVAKQGSDLLLKKVMNRKPVFIRLQKLDNNKYLIVEPSREDRSVSAFFDYPNTPMRVTRNKDIITLLVKELKETGMWEYIENPEFFMINENNKTANAKVVKALYSKITNGPELV